jgi:peptide/nickel transport system substrate-binding protein
VTRQRKSAKLIALLASASLIAAACGGDDDTADTAPDTTTDPADPADPDTDTTDPDTDTTDPDTDTTDPDTTEPTDPPAGLTGDVGEVGGSGCGVPHGPYDDPGEATGEVRVAWNDPLLSFNSSTIRGNATANNNPLYMMNSGFTYYDGDLQLTNNDNFGTCVIESLEPLSVTYRVNEGVTWSDGVPVDAADLLLTWAATSGVYNTGEVELDEDFDIVETDDIAFDAFSVSLSLVTQFPEISADGQAVTITWDEFYVDYQIGGLDTSVPAHVVARNALGIDDAMEAKAALIEAFETTDNEAIKPIADFYNTGFDANALPNDPDIYIGHGAYNLVAYEEVSEMVFEAREDFTWGPRPRVQTIVYRIIGDPTAAVQAMTNEEIDIFLPQATADILAQLEDIEDRGVVALSGDGATYEHVDLVFDNGGPFDPATYGGDEEVARQVRQAFLLTIPREEILERLIRPLNPDANVRNSFTVVPGAPGYDEIVAGNGSDFFAEADIDQAVALLEEAGVETPIDVRFHFADNNPRRANQYDLISASAQQAGFNVIDGRSPTWGQELSNSDIYDASMFGWQSTSVCVACTNANFITGGANNFGGYSNPTVDALYEELQGETDPDEQQRLLLEIETELWNDAFGITIFQFPEVVGYNSTYVNGVSSIPLAPTVFWNFWEWEAA